MKSRESSSAIVLAVVSLVSCKGDGPGSVNDFCAQVAAAICCGQDSDCSAAAPQCDTSVYPPVCSAGLQFGPGARSCDCVAGPCAGTGGAVGGLGGSSGSGGGAGGVGGSSGAGGTAGAGNRDGGNADARDAGSCPPSTSGAGWILSCACSDTSWSPVCVAGTWTCPAGGPSPVFCSRCALAPLPPPGCRCDLGTGVVTCTKDGGADAAH